MNITVLCVCVIFEIIMLTLLAIAKRPKQTKNYKGLSTVTFEELDALLQDKDDNGSHELTEQVTYDLSLSNSFINQIKAVGIDISDYEEKKKIKIIGGTLIPRIAFNVVLIVMTFYIVINTFEFIYVPSSSMEPTVYAHDLYAAIRTPVLPESVSIQRGDIVTFVKADDGIKYVKRIIGMPGETISFVNGKTYINEQPLDETEYINEMYTNCIKTFEIPEGKYFVMGDNRENSFDSRYWAEPYISDDEITSIMLKNLPLHCIF